MSVCALEENLWSYYGNRKLVFPNTFKIAATHTICASTQIRLLEVDGSRNAGIYGFDLLLRQSVVSLLWLCFYFFTTGEHADTSRIVPSGWFSNVDG